MSCFTQTFENFFIAECELSINKKKGERGTCLRIMSEVNRIVSSQRATAAYSYGNSERQKWVSWKWMRVRSVCVWVCLRNITGKSIKIVRCMYMQAKRACTWFKLLLLLSLSRAAACLPGGHYRLIWWTLAVRTRTQPPSFPSISTWINIYIYRERKKKRKNERVCGGMRRYFNHRISN